MKNGLLACLFFLSSCGYRYKTDTDLGKVYSVSVPYIKGDVDAVLNSALVYQLSSSGAFRCVQTGGDYTLQVTFLSDTQRRIDFRYDRDNVSGSLERNLLGVEDRRSVVVLVSLIDAATKEVFVGPFEAASDVEYDYIDPGSPRDLIYTGSLSQTQSIIQFSLGQLDSSEGAYDDSAKLLFKKLGQRISDALIEGLLDKS